MKDLTALRCLMDFAYFTKYGPVFQKIDNLETHIRLILNAIQSYFRKYPDNRIVSVEELETYFFWVNPQLRESEMYITIFDRLRAIRVDNPELLADILNSVIERHMMTKIQITAASVLNEAIPTGILEIKEHIANYEELTGTVKDGDLDVCVTPLIELLKQSNGDGLRWKLEFLRRTFGPLQGTMLGHVFARPDVGKTSFAISEAVHWAYQLRNTEDCVLYLNNEEAIGRIRLLAYMSLINKNRLWLDRNPIEAEAKFVEFGGNHLKLIGDVHFIDQVEKYIDQFRPRVVIVDQGAKVQIPIKGEEHGVWRLQKLYNTYRELGKKYGCDLITLGQADNAAEGRKWLHLNNLDSSKTAVPGELDFCLGIGKINDPGYEHARYFSVVKNKLTGIYERATVYFDQGTCRFNDN